MNCGADIKHKRKASASDVYILGLIQCLITSSRREGEPIVRQTEVLSASMTSASMQDRSICSSAAVRLHALIRQRAPLCTLYSRHCFPFPFVTRQGKSYVHGSRDKMPSVLRAWYVGSTHLHFDACSSACEYSPKCIAGGVSLAYIQSTC